MKIAQLLKKIFFSVLIMQVSTVVSKEYTVSDILALSLKYNEDIEPMNKDYFDPDFTNYFSTYRPNFFRKTMRLFGLQQDPFPLQVFMDLLKEVTETQKSRGRMGDFILATQLTYNDKIIVFGNIQGAFHSLARDLTELVRQGVIDDSFKILDPRCRIFFNGTAVSRSPYILQTLFTILLLMNKNPDNVFYMQSNFEKQRLWKDRGLARQVDILYKKYAKRIYNQFGNFVEAMPAAFCANYAGKEHQLLKITALTEMAHDTNVNQTGDFFYRLNSRELAIWHLNKQQKTEKAVHTEVLIEGFFPTVQISALDPLMFLEPLDTASVWRVFSAPTYVFNALYKCNQDAFAQIMFGKELGSSIIQLVSRNRFVKDEFKMNASYEIDTGVSRALSKENLNLIQDKVYIGSSLDLSKSNYIMGDRVRTGISLAMHHVNETGGIQNKEVQAIILDDEYTPRIARNNLERLGKEFGVSTILLPIGTPTILAAEDLIKSGEILVAFPITGSPALRQPDLKGAINFRPSFEVEVEHLLLYLINESKFKTFGFFYQDDEYGQGCMKKAREVLKKNNIKKWLEIPYARNTTNFDKQKEILKNEQIEALGCFSASLATQEFLRQVGSMTLASLKVFALAFVVDDVFESFVKNELGLTCLFSRVVPNPRLSTIELIQEYRLLMDERKKPYDAFSLEGYIATSVLCDLMKKVTGPITHEAMIQQFEALKDYNFKGISLTFDPQDRQISKRVWFDFQNGEDWVEVL